MLAATLLVCATVIVLAATGLIRPRDESPILHIQEMQTDYHGKPLTSEEHGWSVSGHEYAFAFSDFSYITVGDADILLDSTLEEGDAVLDISGKGVRLRVGFIPNPESTDSLVSRMRRQWCH